MITRIMKRSDFNRVYGKKGSGSFYEELEKMRRDALDVFDKVGEGPGKIPYDVYFKDERELTRKNYERCKAAQAAFVPRNLR